MDVVFDVISGSVGGSAAPLSRVQETVGYMRDFHMLDAQLQVTESEER